MGGTDVVTVLAIDGGGIRGAIPSRVLVELERLTGKPVSDLFDIVAGTSTGGLLALGLTRPGPDGRPAMTAEDMLRLYVERGRTIFPRIDRRAIWDRHRDAATRSAVQRVGAVVLPRRYGNARYSPSGIERVLHDALGASRLRDALTDVIVTAYDWRAGRPVIFRSREAREGGLDPFMRQAARATTAAPTYFPPARLIRADGQELVLIDGGVAANNPVSVAYYDFLLREEQEGRDLDVVVVSLGTGKAPEEEASYRQLWSRGWLSLGMGMLNVVFDGTSDLQDEVVRKVVVKKEPGSRYFRFQPVLEGCSLELDDARPENVRALLDVAERCIEERRHDLEEVAELLVRADSAVTRPR